MKQNPANEKNWESVQNSLGDPIHRCFIRGGMYVFFPKKKELIFSKGGTIQNTWYGIADVGEAQTKASQHWSAKQKRRL